MASLREQQHSMDDLTDATQALTHATTDTRVANYVHQLGSRYQALHTTAKVTSMMGTSKCIYEF